MASAKGLSGVATGMEHSEDLSQLHLEACSLTIGSLDGVHLGHQALVRSMVATARQAEIPAVVVTFFPHPFLVLRGRRPGFYLTSPEEKAALLGQLGVDFVVTLPFDRSFAGLSADEFLDRMQAQLGLRDLWVGEGFALGYRRQGDVAFLAKAGEIRGYRLHVLKPILLGGAVISSTRVRKALRAGDVVGAASLLGRPYTLPGTVVAGSGRGRSLNMPTANLAVWEERAHPGPGVYACMAEGLGRSFKAVTNIGVRPTFEGDGRPLVVETHLLDFEGDLYGQELRLAFVDRLRDERRYAGPEALFEQIQKDIRRAREILNGREEGGGG